MSQEYRDIQEVLNVVSDLRNEIAELKQRVRDLERIEESRSDREGYAEHGDRYAGKHPRSCACDRCLQRQFGSWGSR